MNQQMATQIGEYGAMKISARLVKDEGDAAVVGGTTTTDAPAS